MREPKVEEHIETFKLGPDLTCRRGEHSFIYVSANEIECAKCPVGYPISNGMAIKEGHITVHGEELVI